MGRPHRTGSHTPSARSAPVPGTGRSFLLQGGEPLATLHLAAQKAGIASLPLSTRFGPDELAYCISDCSPVLIAVDENTHALVALALEASVAAHPRVGRRRRGRAPRHPSP